MLRVDMGFFIGIMLKAPTKILTWDPCRCRQPKILTVAHGYFYNSGIPFVSVLGQRDLLFVVYIQAP